MKLQANAVYKNYRQGETTLEILRDLHLDVDSGETVAIIGQSGSGKSTLISLLTGLDRPDRGDVLIDGQGISRMSERELSIFRGRNVGIVFQQFHLISNLTAVENIALPLELAGIDEDRALPRAEVALAEVGLAHRARHFPHQLSGGEAQRIAIARALVVQPQVLFADEPSGNLDQQTGNDVIDLLMELARKNRMTLLLVTHNGELAARCQRILELREGQLHTK